MMAPKASTRRNPPLSAFGMMLILAWGFNNACALDALDPSLPLPLEITSADTMATSPAAKQPPRLPPTIILYESKDTVEVDPASRSAHLPQEAQGGIDAIEPLPEQIALDPNTDALRFVPLGRVTFDSGKWELKEATKKTLDHASAYLASHPGTTRLLLDGHTDNVGGLAYNDQLSDKRATAVEGYLIGQGVDPDLIHWRGHGKRAPVDENWNRLGRVRNRQVEMYAVYLPSGGK